MQIDTRVPGPKFKSRVGEVTPHGLEIVQFIGFGICSNGRKTSFSVYNVFCPHCKSTTWMWGNGLHRNKSCGCVEWKQQPESYHKLRRIWTNEKMFLCDRWKLWDNFYADLQSAWYPNAKIFAKDTSKPLSPDNYEFLNSQQVGKNARAYGVKIVVSGQTFTMGQIARLLGLSRQRVHQLRRELLIERLMAKISESPSNQNSTVNGV